MPYTAKDILFNLSPDGSGWGEAVLDLRAGERLTAVGTDAAKPGGTPRKQVKTWHGPGILTLYRAPNGDVRWFANALQQ